MRDEKIPRISLREIAAATFLSRFMSSLEWRRWQLCGFEQLRTDSTISCFDVPLTGSAIMDIIRIFCCAMEGYGGRLVWQPGDRMERALAGR